MLILGVIVAIAGGVVYFVQQKKQVQSLEEVPTAVKTVNVDDIVNKHIKETAFNAAKTRMESEKAILEAKNKISELNKLNELKEAKEQAKIPLEKQIWKESNVSQTTEAVAPSVGNNSDLYDKDPSEMTAAEKKQYAKEWIANAKAEGYLLELSPNLEVIKYVPIRKPTQQEDSTKNKYSD